MSTKRVSLLTINSLAALSKVHSSRCSSDSLKTFNSFKCLSTATERLNFQSPATSSFENSLEYNQNASAFYSYGQYPLGSQKKPDGRGTSPSDDFQGFPRADFVRYEVPSNENIGGYGNFSELQEGSNGFYQSSNGVYRGNFRSEYLSITCGQSEHFSGYSGENYSKWPINPAGAYSSSSAGVEQNKATLETLDGFCKEGNVKEAVQVLGSLEKKVVPVH